MNDTIKPPYTAVKMHAYAIVVSDAACAPLMDEIDALTARVRMLEAALGEIAWSNDSAWQADRARAALETP